MARCTWLVSIPALAGATLGAQATRPDSLAAGDTAAGRARKSPVCLRDHPPARCTVIVLYAIGVHRAFAVSKVEFETPNFDGGTRTVREETLIDRYPGASLDILWNRDERHALGVGAEVGDARTAFRVVYRRWLKGAVALDVAPGVLRTDVTTPRLISDPGGSFVVADGMPRTGGTLGVDLHYRHWAIVSARADILPGGPPQGLGGYVGVKVDGYWALAATAIAALLYGAAVAASAGS